MDKTKQKPITTLQLRENNKINTIISKIIKLEVHSNLYLNNIRNVIHISLGGLYNKSTLR